MSNKQKTKKQILSLYKRIEKSAKELQIRKTSKYAKEINFIIKKLRDWYNSSNGGLETLISTELKYEKLAELKNLSNSEKQMKSVALVKRYIGMYGLKNVKERANRLLTAIKRAFDKDEVTKKDMFFSDLQVIKDNLSNYIDKNVVLFPQQYDLQGLAGLAGVELKKKNLTNIHKRSSSKSKSLQGLGESFDVPTSKNNLPVGVYSAKQIANTDFETIPFKGEWGNGIGSPSKIFHLLFWGEKGSGKSTLLFNFAKYLAENHNLKILYVANEEGGASSTIKDKIIRLSANVDNLYFTDKIPNDANFLNTIDVLFADSINSLQISNDNLESLKAKYPRLSTVSLLMAYKNGDDYKGDSDFGHNAQAVFRVEEGKWKAQKNRFGGNKIIDIDFG